MFFFFLFSFFPLFFFFQGTIELDGVDIRRLGLDRLRRALAVVPQVMNDDDDDDDDDDGGGWW